ncbi:MAG: ribosome-binding factor A [Candidatus Pacebacteria bacterium]|nr:ribosome-binding factor A [Candidatus Paceibacterota bacterium]
MNVQKHNRLAEYIREIAAEYLVREANHNSLITVTGVELSDTEANARILVSVLPTEMEDDALEFVQRKASDLRLYFMKKVKMRRAPRFAFAIDVGEKNRQRIDEISFEAGK